MGKKGDGAVHGSSEREGAYLLGEDTSIHFTQAPHSPLMCEVSTLFLLHFIFYHSV